MVKDADATYTVNNESFRPVADEVERDVRLKVMVLIVFRVAQVQVLRLNTKPLCHISTHGAADNFVINVVTKRGATEDDLAFNLWRGPTLLCVERTNASEQRNANC